MSNREIVQQLYASFATGDVPAVVAAFAEDIAWTEADGFPLAGTYVGPQAVVENVFMRLGEFSDNWSVAIDRYIADGDTVVADGRYTWNHKETGEPCEVRMAHAEGSRSHDGAAPDEPAGGVAQRETEALGPLLAAA